MFLQIRLLIGIGCLIYLASATGYLRPVPVRPPYKPICYDIATNRRPFCPIKKPPTVPTVSYSLDAGINSFASELYAQVSLAEIGDLMICPFSAQTILALALQGAVGQTSQQMITGLRYTGASAASIAQGYQTALAPLQNNPILKTANKIYLQKGYSPKATFNEIAVRNFYATADEVDFSQSQIAANTINAYVERQTNSLIKNLIPPSALNADTRMVLVNAVYFKGVWVKPFDKDSTYDQTFNTDSQTSADIPIMHTHDSFNFAKLDDYDAKAIEFQYASSNYSMFVILPNTVDGIFALEKQLQRKPLFNSLSSRLRQTKVYVSLPTFKTEYSVTLNGALSNLGMTTMFTPAADFSNLLQQPEPLEITTVLQKTYIDVNEEGTEAAAATGIVFGTTSVQADPPTFNADHPFVYWIQERNKYPYFVGRFLNKSSD